MRWFVRVTLLSIGAATLVTTTSGFILPLQQQLLLLDQSQTRQQGLPSSSPWLGNAGRRYNTPNNHHRTGGPFNPRTTTASVSASTTHLSLFPTTTIATTTSTITSFAKTAQATLHTDPTYCLTAILLLSTFGLSLERRTTIGKALSAPLATMALALVTANLGVLPFASPVYTAVTRFAVPLAVPLLLYDSDLRRVVSDTGSLLAAFGVGAVATVVGTVGAFWWVPLQSLAADSYKVAAALAARHIGGAINFVAVAETLRIPGTVVSAAIAADNVVVALYFALLFSLAKQGNCDSGTTSDTSSGETTTPTKKIETELDYTLDNPEDVSASSIDANNEISLPTISVALSVASSLVMLGKLLTRLVLPTGTSALPLISLLTVTSATVRPAFFRRIRTAGTALGILCIQLFFAASGAAGSIALVLRQAPSLFLFSTLQIAIHFGVLMTLGRGVLRLPTRELYLASNANVGGPTTAAAMAQAKQWHRLVLPALLVGILGYATATGVALALCPVLMRMTANVSGAAAAAAVVV